MIAARIARSTAAESQYFSSGFDAFFFIWAEKSLRRARKQRRSESAEEPVDVESGERSPQ